MRVLLFFCLFIQMSCSSDTHFASHSIFTPEGDELTAEYCTPDQIEYLKLKKENKNIQAEQNLMSIDLSRLWEDIYSMLAEGRQFTEQGRRLVSEDRELVAKDNRLVDAYNKQAIKLRGLSLKRKINLLGEINHLAEKLLNLKEKRVRLAKKLEQSFSEDLIYVSEDREEEASFGIRYSQLSEERSGLAEKYNRFEAIYFKFSIEVCYLLADGYHLTEEGKRLAGDLNLMQEEYNRLLTEHDDLVIEHNYLNRRRDSGSNRRTLLSIREKQIDNSQDLLEHTNQMKNIQRNIVRRGFTGR